LILMYASHSPRGGTADAYRTAYALRCTRHPRWEPVLTTQSSLQGYGHAPQGAGISNSPRRPLSGTSSSKATGCSTIHAKCPSTNSQSALARSPTKSGRQSVRVTRPMIAPRASSNLVETSLRIALKSSGRWAERALAWIRTGPLYCVCQERVSIVFNPATSSAAYGWRTDRHVTFILVERPPRRRG
jgi:hypothetical protein